MTLVAGELFCVISIPFRVINFREKSVTDGRGGT